MIILVVLLAAAFVGVTAWGWGSIPKERRFPVALGAPPSVEWTVSRTTGLVTYLLIGAWLSLGTWLVASQEKLIGWIGVGLLAFFLFIEVHTIRRLLR